ncbi:MAG TPA: hypothetical protein VN865_05285 [Candidatus Acidoferrales bacterium]|nr:hypothetical protein [Candidatus Acidoferrales bacterium]
MLAGPKAIEEAKNQAVLGLASHEKRLNAFEEAVGIRKEFDLTSRSHDNEE